MSMDRRGFLTVAAGAATSRLWTRAPRARPTPASEIEAVAFDGFPVFDAREVARRANDLFPGRGPELMIAWRARQFEYQWLRALGGRYADFWQATQESLAFAVRALGLKLTAAGGTELMEAYLQMEVWPDVLPALRALRASGLRLCILSNMTPAMLGAGIARTRMEGMFERVLSTDGLRTYKPDPRAYRMAVDALGLAPDRILFVAHAGWDAAGAKWFGFPTFWVNREDAPSEELGAAPDAVGSGLDDLAHFVRTPR